MPESYWILIIPYMYRVEGRIILNYSYKYCIPEVYLLCECTYTFLPIALEEKLGRPVCISTISIQSSTNMGFPIQFPLLFWQEMMMELFCKDCASNKQSPSPGLLVYDVKSGKSIFTSLMGIPSGHQLHHWNCMLSTECNKHKVSTNTCLAF